MIAPEPVAGSNPQSRLAPLLVRTLALSVLIFGLLEIWRPYFFLTDDNLDGSLPFFVGVGQNLLAGKSPFISHHLFGGGYDFLRDPSYFVWHPLYLLTSLLAGTPGRNTIVDVDAFVLLMLATAGFVTLAHFLRREMALPIGDVWISFYALSYTYTLIALTTGASWLTFLGDISALPWLALGILQPHWRRGVAFVAIFSLHEVLGGHLAPTLSDTVLLSLFALGLSASRRSTLPLINWGAGSAIALVVLLPLLIPMLGGFSQSIRAGGVTLADMQANNIDYRDFLSSIFLGMALWIFKLPPHAYATYTLALGSSAAAWCLLPTMVSRAKWRGPEVVTLLLMIFSAVLIIRPVIISEVMLRLPAFRAMRWPFREFVQFQFFLHLFLVLRPTGLSFAARRLSAIFGTVVMVVPLVAFGFAPTLNTMAWDRELVLGGGRERFWDSVRPLLKSTDRVAVIIPFDLYTDERFEEPYSLLGSYNYATLDGFINAWGYSPTAPRDQLYTKTYAFYPFGAYRPEQETALRAERPDLKFITLQSLAPLRITLSAPNAADIDLTPFVPARVSKIPPDAVRLHQHDDFK